MHLSMLGPTSPLLDRDGALQGNLLTKGCPYDAAFHCVAYGCLVHICIQYCTGQIHAPCSCRMVYGVGIDHNGLPLS